MTPPLQSRRRPFVERLGLFALALIMAVLFAAMAVAAYVGGEAFLALMAALGAFMALWVGSITLVRG